MSSPPAMPSRRVCFLHPGREAAARCMGCGESYCRECVSEHDLRMLCAGCLRRELDAAKSKPRRRWRLPVVPLQLAAGLLILWFTLYLFGRILVGLPSEFHEGEFFQEIGATGE